MGGARDADGGNDTRKTAGVQLIVGIPRDPSASGTTGSKTIPDHRLALRTTMIYHYRVGTEIHPVWQKFPGLVWSNRNADDGVRIRAALTRPRFPVLLELALVFGLERLKHEWEFLSADDAPEIRRSEPVVQRILKHLEEGFRRADS